MEGIDATTLLVVKLEAQQWNGVLQAFSKMPYEHAAPLIQAMMGQLQTQAQVEQTQSQLSLANGADAAPGASPA